MIRAFAQERIAKLARIQALEDDGVETETPAAELWREMPESAKEHEASREDDGLSAEDVLDGRRLGVRRVRRHRLNDDVDSDKEGAS